MKTISLFFFFIAASFISTAQNAEALLVEAFKTESLPNEALALAKFKTIATLYPKNVLAQTKTSELYSRVGSRFAEKAKKVEYFNLAMKYANQALVIAPNGDMPNVVKAIALGKLSINQTGKEKIKFAKDIRRHLDVALKANPENHLALHVMGRWFYEVSGISSFERAAAKMLIGDIPKASYDEAIVYFEKARKLYPNFTLNNYELAKAYQKKGNLTVAKQLLKELQAFPVRTDDDLTTKKQAKALLTSL